MVVYVLYIKADLENVAVLHSPSPTSWTLDVREANGEEVRKKVVVDESHSVDIAGGRNQANFALTWPGAKKPSFITIITTFPHAKQRIQGENSGEFVPYIAFDCRGIEPISWYPSDDFVVEAESGGKFEHVDLSDDWSEYDEEAQETVSVLDVQGRFQVEKK